MLEVLIPADPLKAPAEQNGMLHNRWHPDLPMVAMVKPGASFRVECVDWTGNQIKDDDSANDVRDVDLTKVHYLSGPIGVEGAEPGDLLVVDILDIGTLPTSDWGFTGIFAKSRHVPGVNFAGIMHPGLIGCLPSHDLLKTWNEREAALFATNPERVPALCALPYADTALMGKMTGSAAAEAAQVGARTVPPREHGGNCDIKNLSRGSKVYFPVYVNGGGLSMGDLHFSQGDGEITFCGAIEMAGWIELHVDIIKGGMSKYGITNPIFKPSPLEPRYTDYLIFEGISVDESGTQHYLDAHVAYRRACLNAIEYLKKFGYTGEQAYAILGTAPVEGHISGIVDIPNACATLWLPTGIFDFDIRPNKTGPSVQTFSADLAKAS